jgi:site-specific DNA-adenine methylase
MLIIELKYLSRNPESLPQPSRRLTVACQKLKKRVHISIYNEKRKTSKLRKVTNFIIQSYKFYKKKKSISSKSGAIYIRKLLK